MAGVSINSEQDIRAGLLDASQARFVHEDFKQLATSRASAANDGEPTGTAGDVNTITIGRNTFQTHVLGTQTILGPSKVALGLDITQDLTNNDGIEYTLGNEFPANTVISSTAGATKGTFVVGTDAPFYMSLRLKITDVSGTDDCAVGFHKAEAYQANVDDYDEAAFLNVISGTINIETILNNAATTTTSTTDTWADAATKTLTVLCDSDGSLSNDGTVGKCYYFIDGLRPTAEPTTRFKFDSGEVVIPFFYFLNDADVAESTTLIQWQSGLWPMGETSQLQFPTTMG